MAVVGRRIFEQYDNNCDENDDATQLNSTQGRLPHLSLIHKFVKGCWKHLSWDVKNNLVDSTKVEVYFNDDDDGDTLTKGSNS